MEARGFPLPSLFWQAVGEQMPALVLLQSLLVNNRWCRDIRVYVLYADLKPV